ncbi:hypothetical protein LOK49_LG09G01446 [Camellia lanceoleosa]|uniref:Uncharacterized protein n=1 Tax=Camellia lanceoleosa TaxID=1840588 RepID=A0ACC0GIY1_9ERIC|nr:hypothetical protein LOK49_LG09G01446 [Camellia lanceoleosa]
MAMVESLEMTPQSSSRCRIYLNQNSSRFCKGNDLAAAISVGVTTVVLRCEVLALFCNWRNLSKRLTHQSAENTVSFTELLL